jgi:hypothetical protein
MEINEFLKAVNETNKANEMAFHYAASILKDFKNLTPAGRSLMADTLMNLISGKREEPDIKTYNLQGWKIWRFETSMVQVRINVTVEVGLGIGKISLSKKQIFVRLRIALKWIWSVPMFKKTTLKMKIGTFIRSVKNIMRPRKNHLRLATYTTLCLQTFGKPADERLEQKKVGN